MLAPKGGTEQEDQLHCFPRVVGFVSSASSSLSPISVSLASLVVTWLLIPSRPCAAFKPEERSSHKSPSWSLPSRWQSSFVFPGLLSSGPSLQRVYFVCSTRALGRWCWWRWYLRCSPLATTTSLCSSTAIEGA